MHACIYACMYVKVHYVFIHGKISIRRGEHNSNVCVYIYIYVYIKLTVKFCRPLFVALVMHSACMYDYVSVCI